MGCWLWHGEVGQTVAERVYYPMVWLSNHGRECSGIGGYFGHAAQVARLNRATSMDISCVVLENSYVVATLYLHQRPDAVEFLSASLESKIGRDLRSNLALPHRRNPDALDRRRRPVHRPGGAAGVARVA